MRTEDPSNASMTNSFETSKGQPVAAEAYAWFAQLDSGNVSAADRAAFKEWINRSPRHAAEFKAVVALSDDLGLLSELFEPLLQEAEPKADRPLYRPLFASLAALTVVVAIGAFVYAQFFSVQASREFYSTGIGEYQTVELADGSVVKLNTATTIEVTYSKDRREVRLAKGEAYFDVVSDTTKPFLVYAGDALAQAVGTAFSLRLYESGTELIVTEGKVAFANLQDSDMTENGVAISDGEIKGSEVTANRPILVGEGHGASSNVAQGRMQPTKLPVNAQQRRLSWTEGLFDFSDTPLPEVVREVSRHTTLQIEIADPELNNVNFGGVFRIGDVDTLLEALPNVGVVVEYVDETSVVLRGEDHG